MGAVQPAYRQDLETLVCGKCGIEFAVPAWWLAEHRKTHEGFSCPNGHGRVFSGPTPDEKRIAELEQQLAREKSEASWAKSQQRSAEIRRGKAEAKAQRLEKRVACGVCPHCQRTFKQLAAHMKTQHPEVVHAAKPE